MKYQEQQNRASRFTSLQRVFGVLSAGKYCKFTQVSHSKHHKAFLILKKISKLN